MRRLRCEQPPVAGAHGWRWPESNRRPRRCSNGLTRATPGVPVSAARSAPAELVTEAVDPGPQTPSRRRRKTTVGGSR